MKFDTGKLIRFAGEVSGCIVMGIVSAATQTLWYRIAEPKILNAMDENDAKQKHPIGFRGLIKPSFPFFRRFCKSYYGEEVSSVGRATGEIPVGRRFESDTASLKFFVKEVYQI